MSNPINNLKNKPLNYIVGYIFFLLVGIIGITYQVYSYVTGTLTLVSDSYWVNPELILTGIFSLFILRPMGLIEIFELLFKGIINKFLK